MENGEWRMSDIPHRLCEELRDTMQSSPGLPTRPCEELRGTKQSSPEMDCLFPDNAKAFFRLFLPVYFLHVT
jgi:hypothetical protein